MEGVLNKIVIPVKGLPQGEHSFTFAINGEFFQGFENGQVKDADCTVRVSVIRHQTILSVNCIIGGYVVTECDRCLDDLTLKVDVERELTVGFGNVDVDEAADQEDIFIIDPTDSEICLDQFVYDYVCLSLPLVKVHPEGKCNPQMLKYLSKTDGCSEPKMDSPFENLKDMLENKTN